MRRALIPRVLLALLLLGGGAAHAAEIEILAVEATPQESYWHVSVDAVIPLSEGMVEAVESGVPLVFIYEFRLLRPRAWMWDARVLSLERRVRLERHALAGKFVVHDETSGQRQIFSSLEEAITATGTLRGVPLARQDALPDPLRAKVRLRLDIDSLPAPMRPVAWLSPGWHLGSGWQAWDLTR